MRGAGQIAELAAIAEPDVGVITNIGPVHLELLGSVEAIAADQGRAHRRAAPRRHRRRARRRAAAGRPPARRRRPDHVRRRAATSPSCPPACALPFTSAHMRLQRARRARRRAGRRRRAGGRPRRRACRACAASGIELAAGIVVIDDCYNANPMSMRAALDDLAAAAPGRRVAVLGDMLELGPDERRFHAEVGAHARGRRRRRARDRRRAGGGDGRRRSPSADAAAAAALVPGLLEPGDTVLVKASRGVGLEVVAAGPRARPRRRPPSSAEPWARSSSPAPPRCSSASSCRRSSSRSCATREFGQYIREEGPEGHHEKAGTPTMGGIIIFAAISIPFLILSDYDWRSVGVYGVGDRLRAARLRRRLHEDHPAPLARACGRGRSSASRSRSRSGCGAWPPSRPTCPTRCACASIDATIDLGVFYPRAHLPRRGGHDERGQPHRRPRRPGRRLRGDRRCSPTSASRSSPPGQADLALLAGCLVGACVGFLWFNAFPATIFMGDTGLARASAARSPGWR